MQAMLPEDFTFSQINYTLTGCSKLFVVQYCLHHHKALTAADANC